MSSSGLPILTQEFSPFTLPTLAKFNQSTPSSVASSSRTSSLADCARTTAFTEPLLRYAVLFFCQLEVEEWILAKHVFVIALAQNCQTSHFL